jgi:hypothetical protein
MMESITRAGQNKLMCKCADYKMKNNLKEIKK